MDRDVIAQIIQEATGLNSQNIEAVIGRGISNKVYIITTDNGRIVARMNNKDHLFRFQREAWCFRHLMRRGVLVPDVITCGVTDNFSYSLAHYIEGSSHIENSHKKLEIWKTLGSYAAILNQIGIEEIDEEAEKGSYFRVNWREQVTEDVELSLADNFWVKNGTLSMLQQSKLKEAMLQCINIPAPKKLSQFDIGCENALMRNKDVFFIDLEYTCFAPAPHYQLSCVGHSFGLTSEVMTAFRAGYGISDLEFENLWPDLKLLVLLRKIRGVAWSRQRLPEQLEDSVKNAKKWINEFKAESR